LFFLGAVLNGREQQANRTGLGLAVGPKMPGFIGVGIFLFFGAIVASLAAITLLR
jgi:hypothetical protein